MIQPGANDPAIRRSRRIKQVGAAAFCFFLVKGLLWVALAFGAVEGCSAVTN